MYYLCKKIINFKNNCPDIPFRHFHEGSLLIKNYQSLTTYFKSLSQQYNTNEQNIFR